MMSYKIVHCLLVRTLHDVNEIINDACMETMSKLLALSFCDYGSVSKPTNRNNKS